MSDYPKDDVTDQSLYLERDMAIVEIWTDGASTGRKGAGGWAYLIDNGEHVVWDSGGEIDGATNNRMEMVAVIYALESLEPSNIVLYSDSSNIINGMKEKWYEKWRRDAWLSSRGVPVVNRDLWERLLIAASRHKAIRWVKVKGHTQSSSRRAIGNRRVDAMAVHQRRKMSALRRERDGT